MLGSTGFAKSSVVASVLRVRVLKRSGMCQRPWLTSMALMTSQVVVCLLLSSQGILGEAVDPATLRKAVLESREKLVSGVFEIESTYDLEGAPPKKHSYFIVLDGSKKRMDRIGPAWLDNFDGDSIIKNCVNQNEFIKFDTTPSKDNKDTARVHSIVARKLIEPKEIDLKIPDVRVFGIVPAALELTWMNPLNQFWSSWQGMVENEAMRQVEVGQKACVEYTWASSLPSGRYQGKLVVSPDDG